MRTLNHPEKNTIALSTVLYALSDPIRLTIVKSVAANGEQACGTFGIPIAKSALSHHFKVLREAGLIYTRLEGTQRINSLRREDLDARFPGLLEAVLQASDPL
jgi:DNA-binding transcriptional ArsR family regulator